MKKIYYLNCVFTAAVLVSCSSTDSLTEPAPNVLGLTMTKEAECEDHNYVREVNPATSEARQRTDEETEYEYVEPVESVVLTYVEGDSLKYKHNAIRLGCGSSVWLSAYYDSDAKRIMVVENGVYNNMMDCMCHYSPEGNIGKLESGKYTIALYTDIQIIDYEGPVEYIPRPVEQLKPYFEKEINFKKGMSIEITKEELHKKSYE